jgi:3-phenylpropionate/trans-cinnamate dioxygenase ferredoxin subunit
MPVAEDIAVVTALRVEEIPTGAARSVAFGDHNLLVLHADDGFSAVDATCTHAAGPLADASLAAGCVVVCPWHAAEFDGRTGAVLRGPARKPLQTYPVSIHNGFVVIHLQGGTHANSDH